MKSFVSCLILLILLSQTSYPQFELNSGVTTELTSSSNGRIYNWYFQGWACGINGTVIRSTINTSSQWINVSGNGIPPNVELNNICGVDSNIAFVAGYLNANTWVWKTTNGGQNWVQVFTQPNGRINAVWMKNYFQGFMQGNPVQGRWSLWKTTNGGVNWDSTGLYLPQDSNETGWPNSFCMPMGEFFPAADSNKIWFGTDNSRVYYSSNYGNNWTMQSTSPEQNILCFAYGADYNGAIIFAGGSSYLFKSTNYGANWTVETITGSGSVTGITFCAWSYYLVKENRLYIRNYMGTWYPYFTAPSGTYKYLDNRGFGMWYDHYAVRDNGGISLLTEGEGVQKISSEIPSGFKLSQNYPNPFNPVTKIKFEITKSDVVKLIVFDVLGREIATLVNEQLQPGTYEAEWDAGNYPSGVYFYKLITYNYTETKKMVLVK